MSEARQYSPLQPRSGRSLGPQPPSGILFLPEILESRSGGREGHPTHPPLHPSSRSAELQTACSAERVN